MLTIRQVADELNCTPQAIYKKVDNQLNNQLKPFIKEVEKGKRFVKMIEPEGVEIIRKSMEQPVDNQFKQPLNNVEQPVDNQVESDLITLLEDNLKVLQQQLEVKDKQLETKDEQLKAKDEQIKEIGSLLKDQQKLNENNQVLLREDQKQRIVEEQRLIEEKNNKDQGFLEKIKGLFGGSR